MLYAYGRGIYEHEVRLRKVTLKDRAAHTFAGSVCTDNCAVIVFLADTGHDVTG